MSHTHVREDGTLYDVHGPCEDHGWLEPGKGYHPHASGQSASLHTYYRAGGK